MYAILSSSLLYIACFNIKSIAFSVLFSSNESFIFILFFIIPSSITFLVFIGTKIILIIDESHYTAASETSKLIIDMIAPEFIVEMTATPQKNRIPNKDDEVNEKAFYVPVKTEKVILVPFSFVFINISLMHFLSPPLITIFLK